jgi:hypothetical protein
MYKNKYNTMKKPHKQIYETFKNDCSTEDPIEHPIFQDDGKGEDLNIYERLTIEVTIILVVMVAYAYFKEEYKYLIYSGGAFSTFYFLMLFRWQTRREVLPITSYIRMWRIVVTLLIAGLGVIYEALLAVWLISNLR